MDKYIHLDDYMGSDYSNWIFDRVILPTGDDSETINLLYSAHSGGKNISPLCLKVNNNEEIASDSAKDTIAKLLRARFMPQWRKIYDALFADYNPIENYKMVETETIAASGSNSSNGTSTTDINNTTNSKLTTENTGTEKGVGSINVDVNGTTETKGTANTTGQVYGYDSEDAVNDSSNTTTSDETTTNTSTTGTTTSDDTTSSNNGSSNGEDITIGKNTTTTTNTGNHDTNSDRELNKHGNIGVTTSQQMITAELELRKTNYYDIIFKDVDNLLCLHIY